MILGIHTNTPSATAILYFTRSAHIEARRKSLIPNNFKRNQKLVKALIDHTESTIIDSGLPYFLSESNSDSLSFGEKLTQNIDHVYAQGYTNIIILGNDCPTLSTKEIRTAAKILSQGNDTYGRATDGGLYLIGLQLESYHKAIFEKLSWSRDTLAEDLDRYLATYSREIHCVSNSIKSDIDNHSDLKDFIDLATFSSIYHIIVAILSVDFILHRKVNYSLPYYRYIDSQLRRGPPRLAA